MYYIEVAFTKENAPDWISRAVMWAIDRPYSHVMIIFEDKDRKRKILHSIGGGTQIDETCEYLTTHTIVKSYKVPMKVSRSIFAGYVRGRVGRDYAETSYVNMFLEKLGIPWVPFKNGNDDVVCSGEVAAAGPLTALDLPDGMIWKDVQLELIDPAEVDDFLSKQIKAQLIS